jgi:hypothetical protein
MEPEDSKSRKNTRVRKRMETIRREKKGKTAVARVGKNREKRIRVGKQPSVGNARFRNLFLALALAEPTATFFSLFHDIDGVAAQGFASCKNCIGYPWARVCV